MVGRHCHIHSLTFLRNERQTASRRLANRYARRYIERTIGTASCQAIPIVYRYLERRPVILSAAKDLSLGRAQILRCAQDDRQDTSLPEIWTKATQMTILEEEECINVLQGV